MGDIDLCVICGKTACGRFYIAGEVAERYCRKHALRLQDFLQERACMRTIDEIQEQAARGALP